MLEKPGYQPKGDGPHGEPPNAGSSAQPPIAQQIAELKAEVARLRLEVHIEKKKGRSGLEYAYGSGS